MPGQFDLDQYLNRLRQPEEGVDVDTVYDDLRNEFTHQLSVRDAKIEQESTARREAAEEIARLKARNYDLLVASPVTTDDPKDDPKDDEPKGVSRLFER
jgi:hypothetical protein